MGNEEHRQWYLKAPDILTDLVESITRKFPTLHVELRTGRVYVAGVLPLKDPEGLIFDRYEIEIEIPEQYPQEMPKVRETRGRIPNLLDRHIVFGHACLFVPDERWRHYPVGATIIDFIEGPVFRFFLNQTNFELTGKWIWGDRSHGVLGIAEYYYEELESNDLRLVISLLKLLSKTGIKGHYGCFCWSGKPIRNCHAEKFAELRNRISPARAAISLRLLENDSMLRERISEKIGIKDSSKALALLKSKLVPLNKFCWRVAWKAERQIPSTRSVGV